jgi:hypothetical protein
MKRIAVLTFALTVSLSAFAQKSTPKGSKAGGGAEQQIKALGDQGNQAMLKGDTAWGKLIPPPITPSSIRRAGRPLPRATSRNRNSPGSTSLSKTFAFSAMRLS